MRVAKELKSLGTKNILRQFNTSKHLLKYLSQLKLKEDKIEYLCGSIVSQDFMHGLKNYKINYQKKIIYETIGKKKLSKRCVNTLESKKIKIVLIYSEYSARLFMSFIKRNNLNEALSGTHILCLSRRISDVMKNKISYAEIIWSRSPNQNSLILKVRASLDRNKKIDF